MSNISRIIKSLLCAGAFFASSTSFAMSMQVGVLDVPFDRIEDAEIKPMLVEYMGFLNSENVCPEESSQWHIRCKELEQSLVEVLTQGETQVAAKN